MNYTGGGKKWSEVVGSGNFFLIFTFERELSMSAFIGDYTCRIDAKGRVLLPSAFIKQLPVQGQDRFVVKKDIFEKCLVLYPIEEWEFQNKLIRSKINPYKKEHNEFLRNFYRGTAELVLDGNNRLLIPKRLIELVGITKELILAGQDSKIEIWPRDAYEKQEAGENEFAKLAEKIMDGPSQNTGD